MLSKTTKCCSTTTITLPTIKKRAKNSIQSRSIPPHLLELVLKIGHHLRSHLLRFRQPHSPPFLRAIIAFTLFLLLTHLHPNSSSKRTTKKKMLLPFQITATQDTIRRAIRERPRIACSQIVNIILYDIWEHDELIITRAVKKAPY
jgi:hypothetical protein